MTNRPALVRTNRIDKEQFERLDFREYVVSTSFYYGMANGIGWSLIFGGIALVFTTAMGIQLSVLLYLGLVSVGMGLGFANWQWFIKEAFNNYNKHHAVSRRETTSESYEPLVKIDRSDTEYDRTPLPVSDTESITPGRFYKMTRSQRESFALFSSGDPVSRRKLERHPAWRGKNITAVWADVKKELQFLGVMSADDVWNDRGYEWSRPPHPTA